MNFDQKEKDSNIFQIPLEDEIEQSLITQDHENFASSPSSKDWKNIFFILKERRIHQTLCYCVGFIFLGLAIASFGPALLALKENTNSTISQIGFIFAARSIGYLVGSGIGGPMFDHFNGNRLLSVALFITVIGTFFVPITKHLIVLALLNSSVGLSMGFLDTGGNVSLIRLHGDKVGPYMQTLHFSFGIGAFISPLIIGEVMKRNDGDPTWGFWVISAFGLPLCFWILIYPKYEMKNETQTRTTIGLAEKGVVLLTALFLAIYTGAEVATGTYLYSYSVLRKMTSQKGGALLTSLFWISLTIGRLFSVPLSLRLSSSQILALNMSGCILSSILWLLFIDSTTVLWIGAALYGFSMSSSFPTAINLAESYMKLSGKIAAVIIVGASFGEMLIPILTGNLFAKFGPKSLMFILFFCAILGLANFLFLVWVGKYTAKQRAKDAEKLENTEEVLIEKQNSEIQT